VLANTQAEHQVKGGLARNVVVSKSPSILQLLAGKDEALLVGWNACKGPTRFAEKRSLHQMNPWPPNTFSQLLKRQRSACCSHTGVLNSQDATSLTPVTAILVGETSNCETGAGPNDGTSNEIQTNLGHGLPSFICIAVLILMMLVEGAASMVRTSPARVRINSCIA
jgi:hypothetical protein